jgi:release factor glutamine methyltransferase
MTPGEFLASVPRRRRDDALWLLSALLGRSKGELLLEARSPLAPGEARRLRSWWKRRLRGEPLQYVVGSAPFYGREFFVGRGVLIPRPETERLVELALGLVRGRASARVLDIGTGSGCVAVTMKAERPDLSVAGSDLSAKALATARKNAAFHGVEVRFEKHDLFSPALRGEPWDLVVSNPPYLDFRKDKIAPDVKRWEPRAALEPAAPAGLAGDRAGWCAERILEACSLAPPAHTALELSPRVAAALERRWRSRSAVKRVWREADLAGRKRFLLVAWNERPSRRHGSMDGQL